MKPETETQKSKSKGMKRIQKILKILSMSFFAILFISLIAHFKWKGSGSNEWELERNQNGIEIWSLKVPGSTLLKFKAKMRVKASLSSAVYYVSDDATGSDVGSYDMNVIEKVDTPERFWSYYSYKVDFPSPIGTMDAVILLYYSQDTTTKAVEVNVLAAPNKIPRLENTWRLNHMNNVWNLTPLENGEVECQVRMDLDAGIPYILFNSAMVDDIEKNFNKMRNLLNTDKYKNGYRPYIKEFDEE